MLQSIIDVIYNTKEKLYKKVKQHQVRKFKQLQDSPAHRNTPIPEHITKKRVIHLIKRISKFAVTTPKVPVIKYLAVTKQICDRLCESTEGVGCSEYYQKTKDLLQDYKDKHATHPNITKQEREAIKQCMDNTWVVLTADKGVAMVVMDKSSYVNKCMALL